MWRSVLAGVAGYLGWWIIGTIGFVGLRVLWYDYASVESTMNFSLAMQLARLSVAVLCSLGAGLIAALIARARPRVPWVLGIVLTLQFLPVHYQLWSKYPVWYHGFFLLTMLPLILLGSRWVSPRTPTPEVRGVGGSAA